MWGERKDSLKEHNNIPVDRYRFASKWFLGLDAWLIADAACGMGYGTKMLHAESNHVVGFDFSAAALQYAAKEYPGPAYVLADIERQTFAGFDALVCISTIEMLRDPMVFIKNLDVRRLVIGGMVSPATQYIEWFRRDLTVESFESMLVPKFRIIERFSQERVYDGKEDYMTYYCEARE
jgi:2-polyprenyl-3-methyl-5-hydroxy-6-metoxy-1,4-benzoquinol methylase